MKVRRQMVLWVANIAVALLAASSNAWAGSDAHPTGRNVQGLVIPEDARLILLLPKDQNVSFHGVVSFDDAGMGTGSMLYPAPNVGGALAALVTHGLINEATKNAQKAKIQREADKVLSPYRGVLEALSHAELLRLGIARSSSGMAHTLVEPTEPDSDGWRIESVPLYSMTQDQRALVLENSVAIFAPEMPQEPAYRNTIWAISRAIENPAPTEYWTAEEGGRLKDECAAMLVESIAIALADATTIAPAAQPAYRTLRYREGTIEKIERAQVLSERCSRLLIRNLRGSLKSVPVGDSSAGAPSEGNCRLGTQR